MRAAILSLSTILCCTSAWASDLAREQRIRNQIEEAILVGTPITLQTGELRFLAIYAEPQTDTPRGAAILLHGMAANPDWVDVINPLRTGLPEYGWETLSLQLPVASPGAPRTAYRALIPEAFPRIDFAVEFLRSRGVTNIALIGHSLGARMGAEWLALDEVPEEVRAFVAVGLSAHHAAPDDDTLAAIQRIRVPLLDVYGSRDLDSVVNSGRERAAAARRAGNSGYRQLEIEGADHFFRGLQATLLMRVRAWLARTTPGTDAGKPP